MSAEELQGQLGERLAGAVVKFAEANGSSLQKLQKDLRDGTVGLDQIMTFSKKLNEDFAATAKKVSDSSADAGQKLATTMDRLKLAVGTILQPIGAEFQKVFADIVDAITKGIEAFNRFMGIGLSNAIEKTEKDLERARQRLIKSRGDKSRGSVHGGASEYDRALLDYNVLTGKLSELKKQLGEQGAGKSKGLPGDLGGDKSALKSFADSAFKFADQAEQAIVGAFKGMEDAMVKFVQTGKLNFKDLANSIIADLTRMFVRYAIVQPLFFGIFPGLKPNADGNVFAKNKIVPYKMGGIVNRPTIFPMADGMGLMGEAGPEAIMPLKRGANGKLGVQSSGGMGNIVVNVDASGTAAQSDNARAEMLGNMLGSAVEQELLRQQRPGGLLFN